MKYRDVSSDDDPRIIMDDTTGIIVVSTDDGLVATFNDGRWEPGHTVPLSVSMVPFHPVGDQAQRAQILDAAANALAQDVEKNRQRHKVAALSMIVKYKDADITIVVTRNGYSAHFIDGAWQSGLPPWFRFNFKTLSDRDLDDVWDDEERARIMGAAAEALAENRRQHEKPAPGTPNNAT